jgi:predicted ATPase/signal transduction histidine kinase/class 3 adenylate cyclase
MARSEQELQRWRASLVDTLGPNASVLADVAPEVRYLIGESPPAPQVSDAEAEARFQLVLQSFIGVFARPEHPLVVFLDDVQWADAGTLRALTPLLASGAAPQLLLLVAWRSSEVDESHQLQSTFSGMTQSHVSVSRLRLEPLEPEHVQTYVAAVVGERPGVAELALLLGERTGGNPFFIGRSLQLLREDGILRWDPVQLCWSWSSDELADVDYSANVVDLMVSRLRRLPHTVQRVIGEAAALGDRFSLGDVTNVDGTTVEVVAAALGIAVQERYLVTTGGGHALDKAALPELGAVYRFVHDRVQEAAYTLVNDGDLESLHLRIARSLDREGASGDRVFEVAHHYERALRLVASGEAAHTASLRLTEAAERAGAANIHQTAVRLFRHARGLLTPEVWDVEHAFAFRVHFGLLRALLAVSEREEFEALAVEVLEHSNTLLERVQVRGLTSHLFIAQNKLPEYVQSVVELVAEAGVTISPVLGPADFGAGFGSVMEALGGRTTDELYELPLIDDPARAAVITLLTNAMPAAAMAAPQYYPSLIFAALKLSLEHGLGGSMVRVFSSFGMLLSTIGQYGQGYAFAQLARELRTRFPGDAESLRGYVEYPVFVQHWVEPLRNTLTELEYGEERALELGSMTEYGHLTNSLLQHALHSGEPVPRVVQRFMAYLPIWQRNDLQLAMMAAAPFAQLALELAGEGGEPGRLKGEVFDFDAMWSPIVEAGNAMMMMYGIAALSQASAFFGDHARALQYTSLRRELEGSAANPVAYATVAAVFYGTLCELAVVDEAEQEERERLLEAIEGSLQKLEGWAAQVPSNHAHRVALVRAELARVRGDALAAMDGYDSAIRLAREQGFVHDVALAAEKAALFHRQAGRDVVVKSYVEVALHACQSWGALAKVAQLRALFSELRGSAAMEVASVRSLDHESLFRATQAISREIKIDSLLERLMRIVVENAGVGRGLLLLENEGVLEVRADLTAEGDLVDLRTRSLDEVELAASVVRYVVRTNETVVLHDASREGRFVRDPWIERTEARSLLCLPLIQQGKRTGVLWLENSLAKGVFDAARVEFVRMLSTVAATSIENALLFRSALAYSEKLEQKNEQLRELDRLRDEFLAKTSHELRTPLHGIIGLAQGLSDDGVPSKNLSHDLGMIVSSGRRLSNLINDLLDFSTLRKKEIVLTRKSADLGKLVEGVIGLMQPLVGDRGVVLRSSIPEDIPAVYVDHDRIDQVLLNLVSNALKFTERGEIVVGAELRSDRRMVVSVRDTGFGISAEDQERIFEVFEQGGGDVSERFGGTGLGLSVAKELVELHAGALTVVSTIGQGSTFSFDVPTTDAPVESGAAMVSGARAVVGVSQVLEQNKQDGSGFTVLVVDDEPVNLQVLVNQLGRRGYQVTTANSGKEALRKLSAGLRPDLILLDVMMPNLNGYEVCSRLRRSYDRGELPVIMVTAKDRVVDLVEGMQAGANDYITKPFASAELLARVRTHLQLSKINGAVSQFVPSDFLGLLGRDSIVDVRLGDSVERDMTILFSDIRSFTSLSEQMSPEQTFEFINEYLGVMEPLVMETGGFVDKYLGDGILALYDTGADAAVRTGINMLSALQQFNRRRVEQGRLPIQVGIGVNTGRLMLGTVGGAHHMDTTVVSDAVNITSRVEALNKRYGTSLLITASTLEEIDRDAHSVRKMDIVTVDGKSQPVAVYEVYDGDPEPIRHAKDATLRMFEDAVTRFHAREVDEAHRLFLLCRTMNPTDLAVSQYIERCSRIRQSFMGVQF